MGWVEAKRSGSQGGAVSVVCEVGDVMHVVHPRDACCVSTRSLNSCLHPIEEFNRGQSTQQFTQ